MKELTFYAVTRHGQVTGVFTTEEAARRCDKAEVSPIRVMQMPGSPDERGWVVSTRGKWTSLSMNAQGVQSQTIRVGPCWGVNVQTAIAGLYAPGGDLRKGCLPRRVELSNLRLYQLDRDYGPNGPGPLELMILSQRYMSQLQQSGTLTGESLSEDMIAMYEQYEQDCREKKERLDSGLPDLLAEHLLAEACRRAPGKRGFCGTYLSRVARDLDLRIARTFTLRELRILGALLDLKGDEREEPIVIDLSDVDLTAVPEQEKAALLARLDGLIPRVRRTLGRRDDAEDPQAIARWILHPEGGILEGSEIDIPEKPEA